MKKTVKVDGAEKVINLGSEIVYGQRTEWCDATWRQLKMSLMRQKKEDRYINRENAFSESLFSSEQRE